ncbi:MAG TPA: TRAP transporter small permease [Hyphomicrobiaceae bacterium]|jgi:TRAP-type C4-dicarboxylate transport system permease small subunit
MLALLQRVVDGVCAALLAVIAALAFYQVIARYMLGVSTPWGEELLRLLFVWLVLLGATRTAHMRIDLLEQAVSPRVRQALVVLQTLVAASLLGFMIWHALTLIELTAYDRYTALPVSVQWLYRAMLIGGVLWLVFTVAGVAGRLRGEN